MKCCLKFLFFFEVMLSADVVQGMNVLQDNQNGQAAKLQDIAEVNGWNTEKDIEINWIEEEKNYKVDEIYHFLQKYTRVYVGNSYISSNSYKILSSRGLLPKFGKSIIDSSNKLSKTFIDPLFFEKSELSLDEPDAFLVFLEKMGVLYYAEEKDGCFICSNMIITVQEMRNYFGQFMELKAFMLKIIKISWEDNKKQDKCLGEVAQYSEDNKKQDKCLGEVAQYSFDSNLLSGICGKYNENQRQAWAWMCQLFSDYYYEDPWLSII